MVAKIVLSIILASLLLVAVPVRAQDVQSTGQSTDIFASIVAGLNNVAAAWNNLVGSITSNLPGFAPQTTPSYIYEGQSAPAPVVVQPDPPAPGEPEAVLGEETSVAQVLQPSVWAISTLNTVNSNLIRNNSFEVETNAKPRMWNYQHDSNTANTMRSAESIRSGGFGLKFKGGGTGSFGISQPDTKTVPGRPYTLSMYIKPVNASAGTFKFGFWDEYGNKYGTMKTVSFKNTKEWQRVSMTVTTPGIITDKKNWFPMIEATGLTAGNVYVDDVQMEEGTTLSPFNSASAGYGTSATELGGGSILFDPDGNLYTAISGQGSLGLQNNRFRDLWLSGNATVAGSGSFGGGLSVNGTGAFDSVDITPSTNIDALDITGTNVSSATLVDLDADAITSGSAISMSIANTRTSGAAMSITDSSVAATVTGDLIQIDVTGTTDTNTFDIDVSGVGASSGNGLDLTYSGSAHTGNAVDVNMGTNVAGDAVNVATSATTGNALDITADGVFTNELVDINTSAAWTGNLLDITTGAQAWTGNIFDVNVGAAASTGDVINVAMGGSNLAGGALVIGDTGGPARTDALFDVTSTSVGAGTDASAIAQINASGNLVGGSNVLDVNITGNAASNVLDVTYATGVATGNAVDVNMGTNVAGDALNIATAGTSGQAIDISATGVLTADLISVSSVGATTTTGVDGVSLAFATGDGANPTNNAINIGLTSGGTAAGDIANGLYLDLASTAGGTDTAIKIQNTAAWDVDIDLQNEETIANATDDNIAFTGVGGTNNTSITFDLDGASATNVPAIVSGGSDLLTVNDGLSVGINGETTENMSNVGFAFAGGNDLYVDDMVGVNGAVYIDGVTTLAGVADGTDALVLTLGDILISNGDLDVAGGDFNVVLDNGDGASVTSGAAATVDTFTVAATPADNQAHNGLVVNYTGLNTGAAANQYAMVLNNVASTEAADAMLVIASADADDAVADAIIVSNPAAADMIVDALDASAANITNALNVGANTIVGTTGAITYTGATTWSATGGTLSLAASDTGNAGTYNLDLSAGNAAPASAADGNDAQMRAEDDIILAAGDDFSLTALDLLLTGTNTATLTATNEGLNLTATDTDADGGGIVTITGNDGIAATATTGDLTISATANSIVVTGGEAAVDAVRLNASNAAGGIDVDAGTGGITVDTTGVFSVDGAAASNVSVATDAAAEDLTISVTGATDSSLFLTSTGTGADAVRIQASAGGMDIDADSTVTLNTTNDELQIATGNQDVVLSGSADGTAALTVTAGDVTITDGDLTVSGGDFNVTLDAGDGANIAKGAAPTVDVFTINGGTSATDGVDNLQLTFTGSNASGNVIDITPSFSDTAAVATNETFNIIDIDAFTATINAAGDTDTVIGLSVGNLTQTETAGTITATAINIGTGWDTGISVGANSIVGTTGLINYTNFDVLATGAIQVAPTVGLDTNAAGALSLATTNATSITTGNALTTFSLAGTGLTTVNVATANSAGATLNLATSAQANNVNIGTTTAGSAVAINDDNWNITGAGAANFVSIGAATAGTGKFTTLEATGDVTMNDTGADTILLGQNGATPDTVTIAGNVSVTDTQWAVTAAGLANFASINSTPIGDTSTSTGAFTSLSATGDVTMNDAGADNILLGAAADTVTITSNTLSLTDDNWSVSAAGAAVVASLDVNGSIANVGGNITFDGGAARTITLANAADNSADFTISAGTSAGAGINGGNLALNAGAPGAGGASGQVQIGPANTLSVAITPNTTITGTLAVNGDQITADGATLVINAAGNVDIQDALNADNITTDTGGVSIAAGQSYTGAGAVTLSSGANGNVTVSPNGTGDIAVSLDADTNLQVTAGAAPGVDMIAVSNAGQASTTDGVDALQLTFTGSNASGNVVDITPSVSNTAAAAETYNVVDVDAFTATMNNAGGSLALNGLNFGNLTQTETAGAITATAINLGTGWDTGISVGANSIVGTTGIIDYTLFDVAATGAITVVNSADVAGLTIAPTVATTTAVNLADADIVNALSVGDNTILGTAAVIDFSEFDVAGATGAVTINDDGNLGSLTVEGTVLDINSLDFVGAGTLTSGANTNLAMTPGGTGDAVVNLDADTNLQVTAGAAPGVDMIAVTNAGQASTTDGVDALQLTFTGSNASGNIIDITPSVSNDAAAAETYNVVDVDAFTATMNNAGGSLALNGLNFGNLTQTETAGAITATAINLGTGWDTGISVGANSIVGTTGIIDYTLFDVAATGAITVVNSADVAGLTIAPTIATTNAITLTDTDIVNALSVGDNTILGTAAVIDFTEFDVSGTTGSVTINDTGDAGNVSVEGTVLDINSLDFVGAGTLTSGANTNLALTPGGTGDAVVNLDADTNLQVTAGAAPGVDMIAVSNAGQASTTDGVDALQLTFTGSNASGNVIDITPSFSDTAAVATNETFNIIDIDAFTATINAAGDTDTVIGLSVGNLTQTQTAGTITATGVNVGTGWDIGVNSGSGIAIGTQQTLTADSTTPSVAGISHAITANVTNPTLISNFTNGTAGQILTVELGDAATDFDCTASNLNCGSVDITAGAAGDILTFVYDGTNWNMVQMMDASVAHTGADVAEWMKSTQNLSAGTVVVAHPSQKENVVRSEQEYDSRVIGVVSDVKGALSDIRPGLMLGNEETANTPVALAGRVMAKFDGRNGGAQPGDALTTAPDGKLMKALKAGPTVGKALGSDESGLVLILVNIGWFDPAEVSLAQLDAVSERIALLEALSKPAGDVLGAETTTAAVSEVAATTDVQATAVATEPELGVQETASSLLVENRLTATELSVTKLAVFAGDIKVTGLTELANLVVSGSAKVGTLEIGGAVVIAATAGEDMKAGDAVRVSSANEVKKADSTDASRALVLGLSTSDVKSGEAVKVAVGGKVGGYEKLSVGKAYFLGTNGKLVTGAPETAVRLVQVGLAISETDMVVQITTEAKAVEKAVEAAAAPVSTAVVAGTSEPTPTPTEAPAAVEPTPTPTAAPAAEIVVETTPEVTPTPEQTIVVPTATPEPVAQ